MVTKQWGDASQIDWPDDPDFDHSGAIDISGYGGISAHSLTPKGYVCFSCGFKIMWGIDDVKLSTSISLPISFNSHTLVVASAFGAQTSGNATSIRVNALYNATFQATAYIGNAGVSTTQKAIWIAVGD